MTKHIPMFVLLVILTGCSKASPPVQQSEIPKQPGAVSETPKQSGAASVAGTTWAGTDSDGDYYEYIFQTDGALHYRSPTGFWTNGSWKQDGDEIYMETNNKNTERKGTIKGNQMKGDAWNVDGARWTWAADKK